jgi:hypothetical protein
VLQTVLVGKGTGGGAVAQGTQGERVASL